MNSHDDMLDSVALYALGALPPGDAAQIRAHLAQCAACREEYRLLQPAVDAVALSAEACADSASGAVVPSPRIKERIMRRVHREAVPQGRANIAEMRAVRPIVWPAYAVAAAFFAFALVMSVVNISLSEQVRRSRSELVQINGHAAALERTLASQQTEIQDLISPDAIRYPVDGGEVIRRGSRLYIAVTALPPAPKGKVYQVWTQRQGATRMTPSVTFVPNNRGVAVIPVPVDASLVAAVAVSIEPDGGSRQPTSTPTFVVTLS